MAKQLAEACRPTVEADPRVPREISGSKTIRIVPGARELNERRFLRRQRVTDNLLRFGVPMLLLLAWQVASKNEVLDSRFWPAPTQVAVAGWDMIESGQLQKHLLISLRRMMIGYIAGAFFGVLTGFVLGTFRSIRIAFGPVLYALYTVPKLALLPVLLLIFGLSDTPTILLIALMVFLMVALSTVDAVLQIPLAYTEAAESFGANRRQMIRHVIFPAILPPTMVSLRLSSGIAILVMVGVEFVHGGDGIGYVIWQSWQLFMADRMYVGIVVVAVVGVVFQSLIGFIGNRMTPWAPRGSR